jgi:hypothetical protein
MNHPLPWEVRYQRTFPEWHEHCGPFIVDANGTFILRPPQSFNICHPGLFDQKAYDTAHFIVNSVNRTLTGGLT